MTEIATQRPPRNKPAWMTQGQWQTVLDCAGAEGRNERRRVAGLSETEVDAMMAAIVADAVVKRGSVCKDDFILAGIPAIEITDERMAKAVRVARRFEPNLDAIRADAA